jgi:hypothetical protein
MHIYARSEGQLDIRMMEFKPFERSRGIDDILE